MYDVMDVGELPRTITRYGKRWASTIYFFNRTEAEADKKIKSIQEREPEAKFIKVPYTLQTYSGKIYGSPSKRIEVKYYAIYARRVK